MSHTAQNWAWSLKIPSRFKFVVVALADMADEDESCYPGHERLADMTGQSVSTVQRAVNQLEQWGLIIRERRHTKAGYRTSDRYFLQVSVQTIESVEPPEQGDEEAGSNVTELSPPAGDNSPTGQIAYQAERAAYRSDATEPTGQPERAKVNPQGEPPGEPPGGASARPLAPTCGNHPTGTGGKPCRACGDARRIWDAHLVAIAAAAAAPRPPRYDPAVWCEHLQLRSGNCETCAYEARRQLQFGGVA